MEIYKERPTCLCYLKLKRIVGGVSVTTTSPRKRMDSHHHDNRRKKSDKAKEKYEKNGKYTQKAIRAMEQVRQKNQSKEKPSNNPK